MTDYTPDNDESEEGPRASLPVEELRNLRASHKSVKDAEARASAAERKLAFVEAGIDLNDPKSAYFVKGYEGEMTPDTIRSQAIEAGFLAAPEPQVPAAELAAHERVAGASTGVTVETGEIDWDAEYAKANTTEEVMAVARRKGSPIAGDRE